MSRSDSRSGDSSNDDGNSSASASSDRRERSRQQEKSRSPIRKRRDSREDRDRDRKDRKKSRRSHSRSASPYKSRFSGDRDRDRDRERGGSRYHRSERNERSERSAPRRSGSGSYSRNSRRPPPRPVVSGHFGPASIDQQDFDRWMGVLDKADAQDDVEYAREKYNLFLERYPYCYGFWQKYAEYEKRHNNLADALGVWERGILAIPLSIELWLGFLAFMRQIAPSSPNSIDKLRALFERAISIAGQDFDSDRLWLEAIGWEQTQYMQDICQENQYANCKRVGELFDRLLEVPTRHAPTHLERYATYISNIEPNLFLSEEEYEDVFRIARKHIEKGIDELVTEEDVVFKVKTFEDGRSIIVDSMEEGTNAISIRQIKHDPHVLELMRAEILSRRKKMHDKMMSRLNQRIVFETNIKRPYFHVKPLDNPQLFNWLTYLDFEIEENDVERIEVLFERCLIATALYEEFWIKYARWAWKKNMSDSKVKDIFKRGKVHVPSSINLTLAHASYEEAKGEFGRSLEILEKFRTNFPGYVLIEMRILGLMRRKAENTDGSYHEVVAAYENLIHRPETSATLSSFYALKLVRFHVKVRNDRKLAMKVVKKALDKDNDNIQLLLQLIDIAYSDPVYSQSAVLEAFDYALNANVKIEDRIRFSQRKLDFMEEMCRDVVLIEDHRDFHYRLLAQIPDTTAIRTKFATNLVQMPMNPSMPAAMPQQQWMGQPMQMQQPPPMMQMMVNQPPPYIPNACPPPAVHLNIVETIPPTPQVMAAGDTNGLVGSTPTTPMEQ